MIYLNNSQLKHIFFNGTKLKKIFINGINVFKSQLEYIFRNGIWLAENRNIGVYTMSGKNLVANVNVSGTTGSTRANSLWFDLDCTDAETVTLKYALVVDGSYDSHTKLKHTFKADRISRIIELQMEDGDDTVTASGNAILNVSALTGVQRFFLETELTCRSNTEYAYTGHATSTISGIDVSYS